MRRRRYRLRDNYYRETSRRAPYYVVFFVALWESRLSRKVAGSLKEWESLSCE